MGVSSQEKAELAAYQVKDMTQVWCEQWKDERPVREGWITWESLKMTFLHKFFSL